MYLCTYLSIYLSIFRSTYLSTYVNRDLHILQDAENTWVEREYPDTNSLSLSCKLTVNSSLVSGHANCNPIDLLTLTPTPTSATHPPAHTSMQHKQNISKSAHAHTHTHTHVLNIRTNSNSVKMNNTKHTKIPKITRQKSHGTIDHTCKKKTHSHHWSGCKCQPSALPPTVQLKGV